MTERDIQPIDDSDLDEEYLQLREVLKDLQATVDRYAQAAGKSVNDMDADELNAFIEKVQAYLLAELGFSTGLIVGMPLEVEFPHDGCVLVTDAEGALIGGETTNSNTVVTGMVTGVYVHPVPSRACLAEQTGSGGEIPNYDSSFSAIVLLDDAKFHAGRRSRTEFDVVHELGEEMRIGVPLVYTPEAFMAHMSL